MLKSSTVEMRQLKLSQAALAAIGRIVRVSADLEDVLNLWVCKLAETNEAKAWVLLGRSNISTKIAIAEGLANLSSPRSLLLHKTAFDENVERLLQCRNAVAHGACVGRTKDGCWTFVTSKTLGYEGDSLTKRANAYSTKTLREIARTAEIRVAAMDELLGLRALRKRRKWEQLPVAQPNRSKC